MKIVWHSKAWEEYISWQQEDKKTLKKINNLIKDVARNGYGCSGKLEALKGNLSGFYSLRIDIKNRLVFKIKDNDTIEILQCGTHYRDK